MTSRDCGEGTVLGKIALKQLEAKGSLHEQPMQQLYRWGVWGVFV